MPLSIQELAALHHRARRQTETAYALAALAALGFAALVNHTGLGAPLNDEARNVISWSFVGLAAADAALLLSWRHIINWITARQ